MTRNISRYSGIRNIESNLEMVQGQNDLAVSIAVLNAEKEAKDKAAENKKVEEAKEKAKKKTGNYVDGVNKRMRFFPGLKKSSSTGTSTELSLCLISACESTFIISFRRRL